MKETGRDTNTLIAGLLRDLAAVQTSTQSRWGYRRAAAAISDLDEPIEALVQPDGTLRKIPNVGPSSTRVILEVLRTGSSATVEQAVQSSPKRKQIDASRELRGDFLSRSQVMAALSDASLDGPSMADYRGDLQMHSVWSDGRQTLEGIVEGCLARGYDYAAVTDHSYGLPIARGVPMAKLVEQHREIEKLNRAFAGRFRLLKGIEANIRADGSIDMEPHELETLEIVVAAPHSALRSAAPQTARMIAAVSTPGVHILGHPRGRKFGARPGVSADWDAVFAAAARTGVAIEIDGDPSRQDVDHTLAPRALRAGCLFALDSDAHANDELEYAETAIAHARLAGIPRDRIINCWPLKRLLTWARRRSSELASPAARRGADFRP
ncbi:MAG TPA: DNA polymerase/3'-5' exonuclease PolX [Vicinamibacterales bacterium]